MIEVLKISKGFKVDFWKKKKVILKEVSFKVKEGSVTGLLGVNGVGKTTLFDILMGFILPDEGKVLFNPKLGNHFEAIKQNIGHFPERPYLYPYLKGSEFLNYMGLLRNINKDSLLEKIHHLASRFGIEKALNQKLVTYSKGMLQRIGLISTMLHDPQLFILDEPFSGLDPFGRLEFKNILNELHQQGKTILLSGHVIPELEEICTDLIILNKGEIVFNGELNELLHQNNLTEVHIKTCSEKIEIFKSYSKLIKNGSTSFKLIIENSKKAELLFKLAEHKIEILKVFPLNSKIDEFIYSGKSHD